MAGEVVSHRILSWVLGRIVRVEGATAIQVLAGSERDRRLVRRLTEQTRERGSLGDRD